MAFSTSARRRRALVLRRTLHPALSPPRQVAQQSVGDFDVCRGSGWRGQPPSAPPGLEAARPRSNMQPPPLRAHWRRPELTARSHSGCGSGPRLHAEIRGLRRRARPAPWSRGGRRWKGLRRRYAAPTHPAPRRRPRCARAPAQAAGPRCASPAAGTPTAMRCVVARAAEAPGARRAGLNDGFVDPVRSRQRAGGISERVLNARGRPAVCKRRLVAAARGPQTTPGGVGRLRTNGAAVWRALGQFGTAVAAGGHGGRAAASGGKHTCVCRRIRCPFLVFRTHTSWLSKRYLSPPSQGRPLPKDHAASTRAAPAPFDTAINAGFWI